MAAALPGAGEAGLAESWPFVLGLGVSVLAGEGRGWPDATAALRACEGMVFYDKPMVRPSLYFVLA